MATDEYELSGGAHRALNKILLDADFGSVAPSSLLDDVLDYLNVFVTLTEEETILKAELESMPRLARESMSRAIASGWRK